MPCRMSPKSSIQVQLKPTENHSTGMLMKVMEMPRAKITLKEQKHFQTFDISQTIKKKSHEQNMFIGFIIGERQ